MNPSQETCPVFHHAAYADREVVSQYFALPRFTAAGFFNFPGKEVF
ncbi:hypothetical protein SAMN02745219_03156 [Desulfofundulus thermosubterraneus DSM 16057]|uniref:Uncharacterized protein n=1 Tax=Desulfofundulus thermosubterraneus DSM 16057 TaxID=1121432 RepID=A0A1M6LI59_9FIRM|nr:hypothetical protein SAMN02745219_03156 [Desulfofundulus thermosubterraneus DSM 16057]